MFPYIKQDEKYKKELLENCEVTHKSISDLLNTDSTFDYWAERSKLITIELDKSTRDCGHWQVMNDLHAGWMNQLKGWCDNWDQLDSNINTICDNIEKFLKHLAWVSDITVETEKAVNALFDMIHELCIMVDELHSHMEKLLKWITGINNPSLAPEKGGIIAALIDYGDKLKAVTDIRNTLVTNVINALSVIHELNSSMGDKSGLKSLLIYWKERLNGTITPSEFEPEITSMITLPICNTEYYTDLKKQYKNQESDLKRIGEKLKAAKEKVAINNTLLNGVNNALNVVKPVAV